MWETKLLSMFMEIYLIMLIDIGRPKVVGGAIHWAGDLEP